MYFVNQRVFVVCFAVVFLNILCYGDVTLSKDGKESCPSTDPDCSSHSFQGDYKLTHLDGVKTGFVQYVVIQGIKYKLITKSMKPLLFEIPEFLADEECDRIVQLAKDKGLVESLTLDVGSDDFSSANETDEDNNTLSTNTAQCKDLMTNFDEDNSGNISSEEFMPFFETFAAIPLKGNEIRRMFLKLGFDRNKDGEISYQECLRVNVSLLEDYVDKLAKVNPLYRTRYSQQAWLAAEEDSLLASLQQRIVELTKLPKKMIQDSEELQVVHYSVHGHFHAHYDSTLRRGLPCCRNIDGNENCNLCRFATILYYLNNVDDGGETAFPIADNITFDEQDYEAKGLDNLSSRCYKANIIVKPTKGTAILWYNHHIDLKTKGMGTMDRYSLHGGCDVRKGIKWIANNWINSPYVHVN